MTPDTHGYLSHKQILVVMGGLMVGMFLSALDQSIVGTALPRITSDLGGLDKLSGGAGAFLLVWWARHWRTVRRRRRLVAAPAG